MGHGQLKEHVQLARQYSRGRNRGIQNQSPYSSSPYGLQLSILLLLNLHDSCAVVF